MRIAYLDCFAGIAGDMFLGALVDAGVPVQVLQDAAAALDIGATLRVTKVDRSGICCTKVDVLEGGELAEGVVEQGVAVEHSVQLKTQHLHKGGHVHGEETHDHPHAHGRSLTEIRALIEGAALDGTVKRTAIAAFEMLGASEAKIHNVPVDEIHFHEVGAVDAIVDIVAASAGIHHLKIGAWYSSALNVGSGTVVCAHGTFPVPAPATADLLRGCPTYAAHVKKELVTPTGAAILRVLAPTFGEQPRMRVESIGYGAGTRNPEGFPNALRLSVGEAVAEGRSEELVTVLETALDDLSPQVVAFVAEKALAEGALDVMLTPLIMKKGRPGTLLTVLCDGSRREAMVQLLLRETSTLGVRVREERRVVLERHHTSVETAYGAIRMKVGSEAGEERNVAPEFEDCRKAAAEFGVSLKAVQAAAHAAYPGRS